MSQHFRVNGDNFEKVLRVEADPFSTAKKMRVQKYPDTCGPDLSANHQTYLS